MDQLPCWRIPALVHLTGTGSEETGAADTLMMFAEGRWINGDGCNPPASGGPTGPVSATCQAKLDAVCNAKANAECIDPTVKLYGKKALPMVGLFDGPGKAWRCYSVLGLDSTHKHWNGTFPGFCSPRSWPPSSSLSAARPRLPRRRRTRPPPRALCAPSFPERPPTAGASGGL